MTLVPLTLAVLDVMLVRVSQNPYVVPLSSIVETMQCSRANFERVPSGGKVLQVRGEYVQVIDLCDRFEMQPTPRLTAASSCALRGRRWGQGSAGRRRHHRPAAGGDQKPEENFQSIEGIAGGTILGDGNVALIVDVQGLKATIKPQERRLGRRVTNAPSRRGGKRQRNGSPRFQDDVTTAPPQQRRTRCS
jgi:two-component system chemotaxis sensor kinase CheA